MSTNAKRNSDDQEVDLTMLSDKIGGFFQTISAMIFRAIQFVLKHIIVLGILFVIGIGGGLYLDKTQKTYDHQIIVQPNFGSTDYLYSKIDLIESKIKERDTFFLKSIGVQDPEKLSRIEIRPIVDVYRFINTNEQNFELLKLMSEDSDIKKIVEDKATSKNYVYHLITFSTKSLTSYKKTIEPLLKFLNTSDFYSKIQKEFVNNETIKIKSNEIIISQIDGYLNSLSKGSSEGATNDKMVFFTEKTQLNDVIQTKDRLIKEQGNLRIEFVSLDKIIKDNSYDINIENNQAVNGKLKLVLPFLFIFIYISINYFIGFYKRQKLLQK